ncbi:hypothetical protein CU048_08350 [Beijerinckiaceae bacterium]|nr:hypothetical protein CU048_08350 [Beijerinckiaceae bacterium]
MEGIVAGLSSCHQAGFTSLAVAAHFATMLSRRALDFAFASDIFGDIFMTLVLVVGWGLFTALTAYIAFASTRPERP